MMTTRVHFIIRLGITEHTWKRVAFLAQYYGLTPDEFLIQLVEASSDQLMSAVAQATRSPQIHQYAADPLTIDCVPDDPLEELLVKTFKHKRARDKNKHMEATDGQPVEEQGGKKGDI